MQEDNTKATTVQPQELPHHFNVNSRINIRALSLYPHRVCEPPKTGPRRRIHIRMPSDKQPNQTIVSGNKMPPLF